MADAKALWIKRYLQFAPPLNRQKRAQSPQFAAGLASESKIGKIPYREAYPAACCRVRFNSSNFDVDYKPLTFWKL